MKEGRKAENKKGRNKEGKEADENRQENTHTRTLTLTTESNWCFVKDAPSMSFAEKDALKPE